MFPDNEIINTRVLQAPIQQVYDAFAVPAYLKEWWGPHGFTNTIHVFELRPGGSWKLTMHGPEKGNYENASVFNKVEPCRLIAWTRITQPWFDMEVHFEEVSKQTTRITFRMIFESPEACDKIKQFAGPKNEENFDRLEDLLKNILHQTDNKFT